MRAMKVVGLITGLGIFSTGTVAQNPCDDIVADTVAEMRAGSDVPWTPALESAARMAAASACVKATSGRYTVDASPAIESTPVAAQQTVVEEDATEAAVAEIKEAEEKSESGGIKFTPLSGPPTSKPYARSRKSKDKDS